MLSFLSLFLSGCIVSIFFLLFLTREDNNYLKPETGGLTLRKALQGINNCHDCYWPEQVTRTLSPHLSVIANVINSYQTWHLLILLLLDSQMISIVKGMLFLEDKYCRAAKIKLWTWDWVIPAECGKSTNITRVSKSSQVISRLHRGLIHFVRDPWKSSYFQPQI